MSVASHYGVVSSMQPMQAQSCLLFGRYLLRHSVASAFTLCFYSSYCIFFERIRLNGRPMSLYFHCLLVLLTHYCVNHCDFS